MSKPRDRRGRAALSTAVAAAAAALALAAAAWPAPAQATRLRPPPGPAALVPTGGADSAAHGGHGHGSGHRHRGGDSGKGGKGGGKGSGGKEVAGPPTPPGLKGGGGEQGTAAEDLGSDGQVDPISGLGIRNPVCERPGQIRERLTRISCEENGTPQGVYPAANYGFDIHISTGVTHPIGDLTYGFDTILNGIWLGLTFVLGEILALLGLAFGLNPFGDGRTMSQLTAALGRIYAGVTDPWLTTLVVCGGIWFAYKGLVKRELAASVAGTLAAIAMLVVGLWVVHQPRASVGRVAGLADEISLGVISAPQTGSVNRPIGSYAEAMSRVWSRLVEVPFAGLDFSDVRWALSKPPGEAVEKANEKFCEDVGALAQLAVLAEMGSEEAKQACAAYARRRYGRPRRVIDLYLRSSPGSPARDALWDYFDNDDTYKPKVAAQGGDGALTRLSMLALFTIALVGSILLLAWLAVRLFTQAAIAFVLLLIAPFALFFPLLGDSGRRAFKTWGLELLGAIVAKVIYAAFLSVVLLGTVILGKVDGPAGSATGFLLSSVFTWSVFLKRMEVIGWMTIGEPGSGHARGLGLGHYHAMQWGERLAGVPFATLGGLGRRARGMHQRHAAERAEATRAGARSSLQGSARALAEQRYEEARQVVNAYEGGGGEREQGAAPRRAEARAGTGDAAGASAGGRRAGRGERERVGPQARAERGAGEVGGAAAAAGVGAGGGADAGQAGERRRDDGEVGGGAAALPSEERYEEARALLARAARNERARGERWSERDLQRFEAEDRQLLRDSREPADHAHRAGYDRADFEALRGAARERAVEEIERARKRDAKRLRVATELPGRVVGRGRRKAEALRQHRDAFGGHFDRYEHVRRLRRERLARQEHARRNLSRGS